MIKNVKKHYDNLSKIYDDLWFYSSGFVTFMTDHIIQKLALKETDKVLDLGAGTGIYSKDILEKIHFNQPISCVDLSNEMLKNLENHPDIKAIHSDAISFCSSKNDEFDKVFAKEMFHHLNILERDILYKSLFNLIKTNGLVGILQLTPTIEYPLFQDALDYFSKNQIHYKDIEKGLIDAGFSDVQTLFISYPLEIEKSKYLNMIANRYMSLLSNYSDEELQIGIQQVKEKYKNEPIFKFEDTFVMIIGRKLS
ncbi:MAG: SAM-dependent methyltransferase [Saprospiraceae bacterium]